MPSGLVRMTASPAGPAVGHHPIGMHGPVTASPYFSSWSLMLCPPRRTAPASLILAYPPCRIRSATSIGRSPEGKQRMFSTVSGRPPMA